MRSSGLMEKLCVLIPLFLIGCASSMAAQSRSVLERYPTVVFDDGISLEEARLIAQRELIRHNEVAIYDLPSPQVSTEVADLPRSQNYWFVFFDEREAGSMKYVFMVIINKENGKVKFAQGYAEEKRWILEAAMLRDSVPGKF